MVARQRAGVDPDADPRVRQVDAWQVGPGTELPGLIVVVDVSRDAVTRTSRWLTNQGAAGRVEHFAGDLVDVVRLVQ